MKARNKHLNETLLRCKPGAHAPKTGFHASRAKQNNEFRKMVKNG